MGLFGSGSGPLGSAGEAQRTYKVSAADAAAMARQWYQLAGVTDPKPSSLAWWTKQIQEDGSHTAFGNFSKGDGDDRGIVLPQTLAAAAAAAKAQTGRDPWTPAQGAVNGQLPGTNYRNQASDATRNLGFNAGAALITAGMLAPAGSAASAGGGAGAAATSAPSAGGGSPIMGSLRSLGNIGGSGLSIGDILKGVGGAASAYGNYTQNAAQIAERQREFNRTIGDTEGQMAAGVQSRLNTAPLADTAQYLLMSKLGAPPTAFHPRDITQPGGANNLKTPATGGAADQLAANQAASAKYTAGAGGVDTSALQLLLQKLKGSAYGSPAAMPSPSPTMHG